MHAGDATRVGAAARTPHPLAATAARLSALDRRMGFRVVRTADELSDGAWVPLEEAASADRVAEWLDNTANGMRGVAGARVGLSFTCCVVRPLMGVLHLAGRAPVVTPATVYVRTDGGLFTELAVRAGDVHALPGDDDLAHPAMRVVGDVDELLERTAHHLYWTLAPVLNTVRVKGRYGLPHLWGGVLDMIGATSLLAARIGTLPQQQTWQRAERLCDLVHRYSEQRAVRYPTPFAVSHPAGDALFTVKGTCCLQYREYGLRAGEQDELGTGYCKTCPFLGEQARLQRCASTAERDRQVGGEHAPREYLPYN